VNTEIDNLKATIVKMIKAGVPVFFGCDVGQHSDSTLGVMDLNIFDYDVRILPCITRANFDDNPHRPLSTSSSV
jgi:aminopeptidase C